MVLKSRCFLEHKGASLQRSSHSGLLSEAGTELMWSEVLDFFFLPFGFMLKIPSFSCFPHSCYLGCWLRPLSYSLLILKTVICTFLGCWLMLQQVAFKITWGKKTSKNGSSSSVPLQHSVLLPACKDRILGFLLLP